jgi:hypothetical protein
MEPMADRPRITVTPRARKLFEQFRAETDERHAANIACAIHGAVGLFPWDDISVGEVIAEFEHEQSRVHRR